MKGSPVLEWIVDAPVSTTGLTVGASTTAVMVSSEEGLPFSLIACVDECISWMRGLSLRGWITQSEDELGVFLHARGDAPESNVRVDVVSGGDRLGLLRRCLAALGGREAVELESADDKISYRIVSRELIDCRLATVGYSKAEGGVTSDFAFEIVFPGFAERTRVLERLTGLWPGCQLRWSDMSVSAPDTAKWEEGLRWCRALGHTPWLQIQVAASKEVWDAESFLERGQDYEVISFGSLKFPRKAPDGSIPKELRGLDIRVDALREGRGWHLAFHLFENSMYDGPRRKAAAALDAHLGGNIITRTPESLWPKLYPVKAPAKTLSKKPKPKTTAKRAEPI